MTKQIITPRIYVSVLADYNNGRMHGKWIDADQPAEAIWQEINKLYITSSDPNVSATVCQECGQAMASVSPRLCGVGEPNELDYEDALNRLAEEDSTIALYVRDLARSFAAKRL